MLPIHCLPGSFCNISKSPGSSKGFSMWYPSKSAIITSPMWVLLRYHEISFFSWTKSDPFWWLTVFFTQQRVKFSFKNSKILVIECLITTEEINTFCLMGIMQLWWYWFAATFWVHQQQMTVRILCHLMKWNQGHDLKLDWMQIIWWFGYK